MSNRPKNLTLIIGGARSGKSRLAESIAKDFHRTVYYLATMREWPEDQEMMSRIAEHRSRRPADWITLSCPIAVAECIRKLPEGKALVVVDCLSAYISNLLLDASDNEQDPYSREPEIAGKVNLVLQSMADKADLVFVVVTSEVGWALVPETKLARAFRDVLGEANQIFAEAASEVILVCAGLKVKLKP